MVENHSVITVEQYEEAKQTFNKLRDCRDGDPIEVRAAFDDAVDVIAAYEAQNPLSPEDQKIYDDMINEFGRD